MLLGSPTASTLTFGFLQWDQASLPPNFVARTLLSQFGCFCLIYTSRVFILLYRPWQPVTPQAVARYNRLPQEVQPVTPSRVTNSKWGTTGYPIGGNQHPCFAQFFIIFVIFYYDKRRPEHLIDCVWCRLNVDNYIIILLNCEINIFL